MPLEAALPAESLGPEAAGFAESIGESCLALHATSAIAKAMREMTIMGWDAGESGKRNIVSPVVEVRARSGDEVPV